MAEKKTTSTSNEENSSAEVKSVKPKATAEKPKTAPKAKTATTEAKATSEKPAAKTVKKTTAEPAPEKKTPAKKSSEPVRETAEAEQPKTVKKKPKQESEAETHVAAATAESTGAKKSIFQRLFPSKNEGATDVATLEENKKKRKLLLIILASACALLLVLGLVLGLVFGLRGDFDIYRGNATQITNGFATGTSKATQTAEYLGTVERNIPKTTTDERAKYGATQYPTYGTGLDYTAADIQPLVQESRALTPYPTWKSLNIYDAFDSEGYLLRNGERVKDDNGNYMKLYKHTASVGMYGGDVSDDEPAVIKKLTFLSRAGMASTQITGLYAPAGELVKIEISEEDLAKTGGLRVYIGQNYNLDQQVSMEWSETAIKGNGLTRMTDILNIFAVSSTEAYVGSFLGGPIYVRPVNNGVAQNFSVTISGAVKYQHFILGVTTPEEYELNKASSAPYFDLEIYDAAVRFTTTKYTSSGGLALKDFTYENCTDAAVLWDKITLISKSVQNNGLTSINVPVMIIGDVYIAAGAAFANPGRNGVVCPPSWLANALNYDLFVNSGCWGTMHEYNHCWQGYGNGYGGEVTNNATTLVSYSLYTRISSYRTIGGGVSDWNRFTDPGKALGESLNISSTGVKCFDLSTYATLLHNIGQESFLKAANGGRESGSTVYYNNLVEATHYDMTYYYTDILNYDIVDVVGGEGNPTAAGNVLRSAVDAVKEKNYPVFVPVSSTYQVGRSILYDGTKKYITTAQPFKFTGGFLSMNFNNQNNFAEKSYVSTELVIPDGFTVKVKSVTQPKSGKVELLADNTVKYTPAGDLLSGEFIVTLSITKDDGAFEVEDVDLVINLQRKDSLLKSTYTYETEEAVPDILSIYNTETNKFEFGNSNWSEQIPNVCTQESGTNLQLWGSGRNYYDDVYDANSENYTELPVGRTIQMMEGVMYFPDANGMYRIAVKGRGEIALYLSFDKGKTYELAVHLDRPANGGTAYVEGNWKDYNFPDDENRVDISCVYFKIILKVKYSWIDFFGIGYAAEATDAEGAGLGTIGSIINASGYSGEQAYELEHARFVTDYFVTRTYTYSYSDTSYATEHTLISSNITSWDDDATETYGIANMFDGSTATNFLSNSKSFVSAENPFEMVVDLGRTVMANSVTFYGYYSRSNSVGNLGMPYSFTLYGSLDGETFFVLVEKEDEVNTTRDVTFTFDATQLKYYKLVVTKTDNGKYFGMNRIEFSLSFPNGIHLAPNDANVAYTGNHWTSENVLCNFGRIYIGEEKDYVEVTFTGTRFAYLAYRSDTYGKVDIYIDGKLVGKDVSLSGEDEAMYAAFISDLLKDGKHTVKIVGKSGKFNVDSFVYWNN